MFATAAFLAGWFGRYAALDGRARSLIWAIDTAQDNFYRDVDEDKLYGDLFSAFALDPYSRYYTADEYAAIISQKNGSNAGAGFSLFTEEDGLRVFSVVENSPAQSSGLKKGMYLFGFGESKDDIREADAQSLLAFAEGHSRYFLKCGFQKDASDAFLCEIASAEYSAAYCYYRDSETSFSFRGVASGVLPLTETFEPLKGLDEKTAYIRIDEFNGHAADEFRLCLVKMKERGREHLVLDLRSNGGGYMDTLAEISSHLLKNANGKNPVIAKASFKNGQEIFYTASGNDYASYFSAESRVTVLADEWTASASECLIGALVDYGTISFGDIYLRKEGDDAHSYGKGIMQSHFSDAQGNVLKLTVAEIFWPGGKSIHGVGVTQDDGAQAVEAPLVWGAEDAMLDAVLSLISA